MNYEDFLVYIYTPLKTIETLSNTIYEQYNNEWDFCKNKESREHAQELLSLNFCTKLVARYLLKLRKDNMEEACGFSNNP